MTHADGNAEFHQSGCTLVGETVLLPQAHLGAGAINHLTCAVFHLLSDKDPLTKLVLCNFKGLLHRHTT